MSDIYAKLQALDITLPALATPAAAYVPYAQTGKLIFLSGHLSKKDGKPWVGKLGKDMDTATGQQAARAAAIELLAQVFGAEVGSHARSAFGVAQIPMGVCVEIEMIVEVA